MWLTANTALGWVCLDSGTSNRLQSGAVVAVPNPEPLDPDFVEAAVKTALAESVERGILGKEATPFLLKRLDELTGGMSLKSNVALVEHNAAIAAQIAVAAAALQ